MLQAPRSDNKEVSLFEPGSNCWRVETAQRVALLTDGAAYFSALKKAAEKATRSILILAWDFNSQTPLFEQLSPEGTPSEPIGLGDFLNALVKRRRRLHVHVLIWDYPMIFGTDREFPPIYGLGWKAHRRVHLHYDDTQPVGASHHQKIVVIDDAVAFCGGIDLTCRRWDTCEHQARNPHRAVDGVPYPPFHDHMMAVDGAAARSLGDLARDRWRYATGRRLKGVSVRNDAWPEGLRPALENVPVAIARTFPQYNGHGGIREVEALHLDMIRAARRCIYIENQYFTSKTIGDALAATLQHRTGPEIIVVLRLLSHGWLEEMTMQVLRTQLIRRLRAADRHGRFHVYYPYIAGLAEGTCIDVHAKLMLVDDEWLRIGSANLANRSMGFDSECDLAIEARGNERTSRTLHGFRIQLLAEHLGCDAAQVEAAIARNGGGIAAAIQQLDNEQRTLNVLPDSEVQETVTALAAVADPEQPVAVDQFLNQFSPQQPGRKSPRLWPKVAGVLAGFAALTLLWEHTPLAKLATPQQVTEWAAEVGNTPWIWLLVLIAYTPACIVMFPRTLITLFAVLTFGSRLGFALAMGGILIAAALTYYAGRKLHHDTVQRFTAGKLNRIAGLLRRRGLLAMTALRLVPVAPFAVEGVVAGAIRMKFWQFAVGTALGMLPGTLATTIFGDQLMTAIAEPRHVNVALLLAVCLFLVAVTWAIRRWLWHDPDPNAAGLARTHGAPL